MSRNKRFLLSLASMNILSLGLATAGHADDKLSELACQLREHYTSNKWTGFDAHFDSLNGLADKDAATLDYIKSIEELKKHSKPGKDRDKALAAGKKAKAAFFAAHCAQPSDTRTVASSNVAPESSEYVAKDLTAAEVGTASSTSGTAFRYFSVKVQDTTVSLSGTVYSSCASKFQVVPVAVKTPENGDYVGFRIVDAGGGLICVKEIDAKATACGTNLNLTRDCTFGFTELKNLPGTTMTLPSTGTASIGLQTQVNGQPSGMKNFAPFAQGAIAYVSPEQRVLDERERLAQDLTSDFRNCRNSLPEIEDARSALTSLVGMGKGPDNVQDALKKLNRDQMKVYMAEIAKAKSPEELEELRELVLSFASERPVGLKSDDFATALQSIAARFVQDSALGEERFRKADETITAAEGIAGLSSARQGGLKNNHTEIGISRMTAMADEGYYGNTALASYLNSKEHREFSKQIAKYMNQSCGRKGTLEACVNARTAAQNVMTIEQNLRQNFYNPAASPQAQMYAQMGQHQNAQPTVGGNQFNPMAGNFGQQNPAMNGMNTFTGAPMQQSFNPNFMTGGAQFSGGAQFNPTMMSGGMAPMGTWGAYGQTPFQSNFGG